MAKSTLRSQQMGHFSADACVFISGVRFHLRFCLFPSIPTPLSCSRSLAGIPLQRRITYELGRYLRTVKEGRARNHGIPASDGLPFYTLRSSSIPVFPPFLFYFLRFEHFLAHFWHTLFRCCHHVGFLFPYLLCALGGCWDGEGTVGKRGRGL